MNKKAKTPTIVVFAVLTAITTFIWIAFEVYQTISQEPAPTVAENITAQLDPTLDSETLSELTGRIHLEDSEILDTEFLTTPTPEPLELEPTPTPTPTPEAQEEVILEEEQTDADQI